MPLATIKYVTINTPHPKALAEFYAKLLGGTLDANGHDTDDFASLELGPGQVGLMFQRPNDASQQVHLDCEVKDEQGAVKAVVAAGGKLVAKRGGDDFSWITLTDPEGNPFDIYASGQE